MGSQFVLPRLKCDQSYVCLAAGYVSSAREGIMHLPSQAESENIISTLNRGRLDKDETVHWFFSTNTIRT